MSPQAFHFADQPSKLSLRVLNNYCARKEMSPKNRAHRLRVIRQQTELLARQSGPDTGESRT